MKKLFILLLIVSNVLLFFSCVTAQEGVFTVDPDVSFYDKDMNADDKSEFDLPNENKDAKPEEKSILVREDGTIENADCIIYNPLQDNPYYIELVGEITEKDHVIGPDDAVMTVIEYGDFQCPGCSWSSIELMKYQKKHPDEVRVVFRHYPLSMHPLAWNAAYFAEAAEEQNMFFPVAEFLYEKQDEWTGMSLTRFEEWMESSITEYFPDIDISRFMKDYIDELIHENIRSVYKQASESGLISATPTLLINYSPFSNGFSESALDQWLSVLRHKDKMFEQCPDFRIDQTKTYRAVFETSAGNIEAELYPEKAPLAVSNLIYLAENSWYDDMPVTQVEEGYAVQFGDPSATGYLNSGYTFAFENTGKLDQGRGYISLFKNEDKRNSSVILFWLDPALNYLEALLTDENLSETEKMEFSESFALLDMEKQTVFGKITDETYETAASLTAKDKILSVKIIESEAKP